MTLEQGARRRRYRRAGIGAALVAAGSVGLVTLPLAARLSFMSDAAVFSLLFGLAALMGFGAVLAVFNLRP
jgi:hypothetical protein